MIQQLFHFGIHFLVPLIVAIVFFKSQWKMAFFIMIGCILIDLDHLLAIPIYEPLRCSINFHPLHTYYALAAYVLLFLYKKTRILGLGLLIHILADIVDCLFM